MATWDEFYLELEEWQKLDRSVKFWWRDDDAIEKSPNLEKLLEISNDYNVPLALAVIPAFCSKTLVNCVRNQENIAILQHGFSHINRNHKNILYQLESGVQLPLKMELGPDANKDKIISELKAGYQCMVDLFGKRFTPVLVPPFNYISNSVKCELPSIGIKGLSTVFPRKSVLAAENLIQINIHTDIINWDKLGFNGEENILEDIVLHLRNKRLGNADVNEPTGIMTHHLVHDENCWLFLKKFLEKIQLIEHVEFISIDSQIDDDFQRSAMFSLDFQSKNI